jgi:hypothetical protein
MVVGLHCCFLLFALWCTVTRPPASRAGVVPCTVTAAQSRSISWLAGGSYFAAWSLSASVYSFVTLSQLNQ